MSIYAILRLLGVYDGDPWIFSCRSGEFHAGLLKLVRHVFLITLSLT